MQEEVERRIQQMTASSSAAAAPHHDPEPAFSSFGNKSGHHAGSKKRRVPQQQEYHWDDEEEVFEDEVPTRNRSGPPRQKNRPDAPPSCEAVIRMGLQLKDREHELDMLRLARNNDRNDLLLKSMFH